MCNRWGRRARKEFLLALLWCGSYRYFLFVCLFGGDEEVLRKVWLKERRLGLKKKKKKKRGKKGKYKFEFPESQQTNVEGKKLTLLRPAWVNQNGFAVKGYRCGPIEHVNQTEDIAGQWTIKHNHHTLSLDEWKAGSYLSYLCIWYPNAFTEAEFIVSFIWCYLSAFLSRCRVAHFGAVKDGLRITIFLNRERELW